MTEDTEYEFEVLPKEVEELLSQKIYELKSTRLKKEDIKELEEIQKEELIDLLKSYDLLSYSAHDIEVKYHEPKINFKFDSARFKEEHPDMFETYQKESQRREFLSIHFYDE